MNTLLLFFALPVATILLTIVVEKILRNPFLTSITFFAIYLIVAFAVFDETFLIYVIVYTILAFITAIIAGFFFQRCREQNNNCNKWISRCFQNNNTITLSEQDIARITNGIANIQNSNSNNTCNCCKNNTSDVATVNVTNNTTGGRTSWCCYRR